jgi:hypothetical protein
MFSREETEYLRADGQAITENQIETCLFHGKAEKRNNLISFLQFS